MRSAVCHNVGLSLHNVITMMSHEHHGISNHCQLDCLFNSLLMCTTNKTWKHSYHWPFVRGIHWWPVDSPHKGPVMCRALSWRHHGSSALFSVCGSQTINTHYASIRQSPAKLPTTDQPCQIQHCLPYYMMCRYPWRSWHSKCQDITYHFEWNLPIGIFHNQRKF